MILYSNDTFNIWKIVDLSPGIVIPDPDLLGLKNVESSLVNPGKLSLLNSV